MGGMDFEVQPLHQNTEGRPWRYHLGWVWRCGSVALLARNPGVHGRAIDIYLSFAIV